MSLQKSLTQLSTETDKHVTKFVKNETQVNLLRVALIAYSVFINKVPSQVIGLFDMFAFRLVISGMIAYLLFKDVVTALLLSLCFIMSIQELKKRQGGVVSSMVNNFDNTEAPSPNPSMTNTGAPVNHQQPMFLDEEPGADPEESGDPAFKTITQNLVEGSFTSDQQFKDAQNNGVQGNDPDVGVKTFVTQHGAQGLDVPLGLDPDASKASAF